MSLKHRSLLTKIFLAYLALSLLLLLTPARYTDPLRHLVLLPLGLAQRAVLSLSRLADNAARKRLAPTPDSPEHLRQRLTQLQAQLQREIQRRETAEKQLEQYQLLPPDRRRRTVLAHVSAFGASPLRHTATIAKGTLDHIAPNQPVFANGVVAGRVISAQPATAEIILIGNPRFRLGVRCVRTRVQGILEGTGRRCIVKYVGRTEDVKPGDLFVTSGLDAIFPPGHLVGHCTQAGNQSGEIHQWIELQPACDIRRLEAVAVALPDPSPQESP